MCLQTWLVELDCILVSWSVGQFSSSVGIWSVMQISEEIELHVDAVMIKEFYGSWPTFLRSAHEVPDCRVP